MATESVKSDINPYSTSFQTETRQKCFVCLADINTINRDNFCSVWTIFRHLKINTKQFCNADKLTEQFPNFLVPLCNDKCKKIVEHLTKLCREFETLQMKIDDGLQNLQTLLRNCLSENGGTENDYSVIASMRTAIKKSCDARLRQVQPRVNINCIKENEAISANLYSEEQVVIKQECLEEDVPENLEHVASHSTSVCLMAIPIPENNLEQSLPHPSSSSSWVKEKTECETCNQTFQNSSCLLRHLRLVHPSQWLNDRDLKSNEIRCTLCERVVIKNNLWRHKKLHCPGRVELITADPLGEEELEKAAVEPHVSFTKHPTTLAGHVRIPCNLCGKLISKQTIRKHLQATCKMGPRLTLDSYNKERECEFCGQRFQHQRSYRRHVLKAHSQQYQMSLQNPRQNSSIKKQEFFTNNSPVINEDITAESCAQNLEENHSAMLS